MATLQTLRNRAGAFIAIMIGLALLAFILTDLIGRRSNGFLTNDDTIGKIDGQKIKIQDFQRKVEEYEAFQKMNQQSMSLSDEMHNQIREQVWQNYIQEIAFGQCYERAGIDVTPEELYDMAVGNHISPALRNLFTNPQTGIYDRGFAQNFLMNKNQDPNASFYWSFVEKSLKQERLGTKYMTLIKKGLYVTKSEYDYEVQLRSRSADISYVSVRYTAIPDSTVNVTESEIKARYNKNKELYKVEDARDIEYVAFPIEPTEEDRQATEEYVENLKADFADPETDPIRFATVNSETPYTEKFRTEAELGTLAEWAKTAKQDDVYGPYKDGDAYCIARLLAIEERPDTVKARHILIRDNQQLADSLFDRAKAGDDFAQLARKYSEDPGSAVNGGDLGWFKDGMMVPEFNEACFTNPKGAIVMVTSQFGVHIINVQDKGVPQKKYNIATVDKSVQYSSKTHQDVFTVANQFAIDNQTAEKFDASADTLKLAVRKAVNLRTNGQNVNNLRHARDIVKWAFTAEVGDVSELFECDDQFVVAKVVKVQEKGYAPVSDVEGQVERDLMKEKKTQLVAEFASGKTLEEIAENYKSKVSTASDVNFAQNSIPGVGNEPNLVGSVVATPQSKEHSSVKGNNATYIYTVGSEKNVAVDGNKVKTDLSNQYNRIENTVSKYIADVDIYDNRIKFY